MNTRLHTRVRKLEFEINSKEGNDPLLIDIAIIGPGEADLPRPEIKRIQGANREWHRQTRESVEDFTDRALGEAQRESGAGRVVCIGFSE